jgi:hypothetical protein
MLDHGKQWIEISVHIYKAARFGMYAQLRPRPLFKYFFKSSRAARQSNESVREAGHQFFALVHGFHDAEIRYTSMRDLTLNEGAGHHSGHLAAGGEHFVRKRAH